MMPTTIPQLKTSLQKPLQFIEESIIQRQTEVEAWFREQWQQTPSPIYGSVDIRNAGFKLSPVDMNLFPAGFNNLSDTCMPLAVQAAQSVIGACHPGCTKILLIPENHTRNLFYLESLAVLRDILLTAGYQVRLGSLLEDLTENKTIELPSGKNVLLEPVRREGGHVFVGDFKPCMVWLNNDLSSGCPEILKDIKQDIRPPMALGWASRLKSEHFYHYQQVVNEFAKLVEFDPWLLTPAFRSCGEVNFLKREGEECLAHHTGVLLATIREKYKEYNIKEEPFVVVKADSGTYGMSVMMIRDPSEFHELNRKTRTKMSASKGGGDVRRVIVQEGVHSFETWQGAVAEPVVYMMGQHVIGGFYRVHQNKGQMENLNSPGAHFEPLAFCEPCNTPSKNLTSSEHVNRFYTFGVVARLSLLAAAREKNDLHGGAKT